MGKRKKGGAIANVKPPKSSSPYQNPTAPSHGRHIVGGSVRVLLAEALFPLTGLITAIYLTRALGKADYGLFTLASTFIVWIEYVINALFARASIKLIGAARDWQPVGGLLLRAHLIVGLLVVAIVWSVAGPIARGLGAPAIAAYLRLFAIDVPLFALALTHRNILIGIGGYRQRAWIGAGRWIARLVLIILLVELGFSVKGAILGSIGASLAELAIGRYYIRPKLFHPESLPTRRIWDFAVLLFLSSICLQLVRMDLFALKALGASLAQTGVYAAAQNLSFIPGLLGISITPLLLSTLTRLHRDGEFAEARAIARNSIRVVIVAVSFAAAGAGAGREIVALIFPPEFSAAGPLVSVLLFAGVASVTIAATNSLFIAHDRPGWTLLLSGPLVPLAIVGYLLFVPRYGAAGAAAVTTICTVLGAIAGVVAAIRLWELTLPLTTIAHSLILAAGAFAAAYFWPTPGLWVVPKLIFICALLAGAFLLSGELKANEISFLRSMIPRRGRAIVE